MSKQSRTLEATTEMTDRRPVRPEGAPITRSAMGHPTRRPAVPERPAQHTRSMPGAYCPARPKPLPINLQRRAGNL